MSKQDNIPILAIGVIGGLALFFSNKKKKSGPIPVNTTAIPTTSPSMQSKGFPLRLGSRGNLVRELQRALLRLGGRTAQYIIKTGGTDGIFGNGTKSALLSAGYPEVITKELYDKIIAGTEKVKETFQTVGTYLFVDTTFFDTSLYMNVGFNGSRHIPEFPFIELPDKTYLGRPTGQVRGKYIEVRMKLNNAEAKFWVDRNDTETFTGNAIDFDDFLRKRKRMTSNDINTIVNAFS